MQNRIASRSLFKYNNYLTNMNYADFLFENHCTRAHYIFIFYLNYVIFNGFHESNHGIIIFSYSSDHCSRLLNKL